MSDRLDELAANFAVELDDLLNHTVTVDASVQPFRLPDGAVVLKPALPGQQTLSRARGIVPLSIAADENAREQSRLWLRLQYKLRLDGAGEHLAVTSSIFGYCVNPTTDYCLLRVEYVRDADRVQQSHVNVHGESAGLAYAIGLTGRPYVPLSKLHIPMGGRRFRASLEDFIEFLQQERLVVEMHPGWADVVERHRSGWYDRQARATVRRSPETSAEQLRSQGYTVTAPGESGGLLERWRSSRKT